MARRAIVRESTVTVRVPIVLERDASDDPKWNARVDYRNGSATPICGWGAVSEAEAKAGAALLIEHALSATVAATPIVVLGGEGSYADQVHIIMPTVTGVDVYVASRGRAILCSSDWSRDGDTDTRPVLERVLEHVGGGAVVLRA